MKKTYYEIFYLRIIFRRKSTYNADFRRHSTSEFYLILKHFTLAYELWFKQILYEVDSIREIFLANEQIYNHNGFHGQDDSGVDERKMLQINNRLSRMGMFL